MSKNEIKLTLKVSHQRFKFLKEICFKTCIIPTEFLLILPYFLTDP